MPGRQSKLTGTVVPEVDTRALDRVGRKMDRSLSRVSNIMPSTGVGRLSRIGRSRSTGGGGDLVGLAQERNALLRQIAGVSKKGALTTRRPSSGSNTQPVPVGLPSLGSIGKILGPATLIAGADYYGRRGLNELGKRFPKPFKRLMETNRFREFAGNPFSSILQGGGPTGIPGLIGETTGQLLSQETAKLLRTFEWPDLPELPNLNDMNWPELPALDELDWPALPNLNQEVDWPELPSEIANLDQTVDWPDPPPWIDDLIRVFEDPELVLSQELGIDLSFDLPGLDPQQEQALKESIERAVLKTLRRQLTPGVT